MGYFCSFSCLGLRSLVLAIGVLCILLPIVSGQTFQVTFTFVEEQAPETLIGNLSTADGFSASVPQEDHSSLLFSFLEQTSIQSIIWIKQQTGLLYTSVRLDRESIEDCKRETECILTFDVAVRSTRPQSDLFSIITVTLVVLDKNDNTPTFEQDVFTLNVSESAPIGTSYRIDSAHDEDTGPGHSIVSYEIIPNDTFTLNVTTKKDGSFDVKLVVNKSLDREIKDAYQAVVYAKDGGTPPKTGSVSLHIRITDVNDNAPYFEQEVYDVTINESIPVNSSVVQVSATDLDIGVNGELEYQFSPNQAELTQILKYFGMNKTTGEVLVASPIEYENGRVHRIIVEAHDMGERQIVSKNQAVVNIRILDTGNKPPFVRVNLLPSGGGRMVNVSEMASKDTFVAHVSVEDKDTGQNGNVSCKVSNSVFDIQKLTENKGYKVVVQGTLDRETQDMYMINVTCSDNGTPPMSASDNFYVHVTDENDKSPVFSESVYSAFLDENIKERDAVVIQVAATDDDFDKNAQFDYFLDPSNLTNFGIRSDGTIIAKTEFDRENISDYIIKVYAVDHGIKPLTGSALVQLQITDVNDNPPKFSNDSFVFGILEDSDTNTLIGTLSVSDADAGDNAMYTVEYYNTNSEEQPFKILATGEIKSNRALDREKKGQYQFKVKATDKGQPKLSSTALVIVNVLDVNEFRPNITFPTVTNKTVYVSHLSDPGTVITRIMAHDDDLGRNAKLIFTISSGNKLGLFALDVSTGVLYLSKRYFVEKDEEFNLIISVRDDGETKQLSDRAELDVIIEYSNATLPPSKPEESGSNNMAIVVIVIVITVLLSAAIIVVICVLRKLDRNRQNRHASNSRKGANNFPGLNLVSSQDNSILSRPYDKVDLPKKRKEVSFSLEEGELPDLSFSNMSTFSEVPQNSELSSPPPQYNQLKSFQLQQALLESANQSKQWHQKQPELKAGSTGNPEDSHSETSRETVTSDSGRGGSEDDLPISSGKDDVKPPRFHNSSNNSSHILKCSVPNKPNNSRREIPPEQTHSSVLEDRTFNNNTFNPPNDKSTHRQSLPILNNNKPKFTVRQPYNEKRASEKKTKSNWHPSYV